MGMPASLLFTVSQSLLKLISIESLMPSNHLVLCHPLLLLLSIFPSIRIFDSGGQSIGTSAVSVYVSMLLLLLLLSRFSRATPKTAAHQAPPSLGFSRQEYWSGLPLPSPIYISMLLLLSHFSRVRLFATPQTVARQAPPSLGFSRQEHWSGLPFPSPMHESGK